MIEDIRQLIEVLTIDPSSADDLAKRIGAVVEDRGPQAGLVVRPSSPRFREAVIFFDATTRAPTLVDLHPAAGEKLTVAALRAAFGDYQRLRTDFEQPSQILFRVDPPGKPYRAAILARLDRPGAVTDDATVATLTLRRDQRL